MSDIVERLLYRFSRDAYHLHKEAAEVITTLRAHRDVVGGRMTQDELDRLKALAEKATEGEWRVGAPSVMNGVQIFADYDVPVRSDVICTMPHSGKGRTANARYIAAANPQTVLALIALIKERAGGSEKRDTERN